MSRAILPLLVVATAACNPSIHMQVLEPSLVTSPPDIHKLAVVDRSRAKNTGQAVLGTLESIVTGEGINADNEGRNAAMGAVVMGLQQSPRFDAAEVFIPKKELESSLFDTTLSWPTAKKICVQSGCQGIVSLEAFDSDSSTVVDRRVEVDEDENGKEVRTVTFEAQRTTRIVSGWRYYDVVGKQILDDVRTFDTTYTWTETGRTEGAALGALPPQAQAVIFVGEMAGRDYSRRIAPTWVWVTRKYYGRGHEQLKLGKNYVKAFDWAGAVDVWDALYRNDPDPKVRGKAAYNLALAAEREGDLRNAASWATEAAVLLGNGRSRDYRRTLERRIADQARVESQMSMTSEPGQVEDEAAPLAKPVKPSPPSGKPGNRTSSGSSTPSTPSGRAPAGNR